MWQVEGLCTEQRYHTGGYERDDGGGWEKSKATTVVIAHLHAQCNFASSLNSSAI